MAAHTSQSQPLGVAAVNSRSNNGRALSHGSNGRRPHIRRSAKEYLAEIPAWALQEVEDELRDLSAETGLPPFTLWVAADRRSCQVLDDGVPVSPVFTRSEPLKAWVTGWLNGWRTRDTANGRAAHVVVTCSGHLYHVYIRQGSRLSRLNHSLLPAFDLGTAVHAVRDSGYKEFEVRLEQ